MQKESKVNTKLGWAQIFWQKICYVFVVSFYKKIEIQGAEQLENNQPVVLCANHCNALADAVLLQYTSTRLIHPLARSGLFKNPILKIILTVWQAVPVYRRQDSEDGVVDNDAMFEKVYEMLHKNQILMIFPEGQSHSDLQLRQIKTGVSRIILGYKAKYGVAPLVVPVGLNFTHTIKFRSNVFINFGQPLQLDDALTVESEDDITSLTEQIMTAMKDRVLQVKRKDDLVFVNQVERFFSLRHKKIRRRNLSQKFKSHKLLISANEYLHDKVPNQIESFKQQLKHFNRLCNKLGVNDYSLNVSYSSKQARRFLLRSFFIILVVFPVGILGLLNSLIPYSLTRFSARLFAKGKDQYDTTKILAGSLFFIIFWTIQSNFVYNFYGSNAALVYVLLLIPSSLTALIIDKERVEIIDNLRVFIILIKSRNLRRYLLKKRKTIEKELAELVKVVRKQ